MTTTTRIRPAKPLTFSRKPCAFEGIYYTAKAEARVYDIERAMGGGWTLEIHKGRRVADLLIRDGVIEAGYYDTKRDAVAVARAYEDLGDDYRDADHGGKSRFTTAVLRAFGKDEA